MMATTHAFVSLAVAIAALPVLSEYLGPPVLLAAAFAGGLAPDVDLVGNHRKTLHYPVGASLLTIGLFVVGAATGSGAVVLAAVAVGSAALHALADILGGSPEPEPWDPSLDRAVYNHLVGRWHPARRYVRYSGAPEDFVVGFAFAAPAIYSPATGGFADLWLLASLVVSGIFALARKRLHSLVTYPRRLSRAVTQRR